jgi:hypothetical protein
MFPERGFLPAGSYLHFRCKTPDVTFRIQITALLENENGFFPFFYLWAPLTTTDTTFDLQVGGCIIHSIDIKNSITPTIYSSYPIQVKLSLGGPTDVYRLITLISGFLDSFGSLSYPEIVIDPYSREVRGSLWHIPTPAAGSSALCPGIAGCFLKPIYIGGWFTTEVTAGNRQLYLAAYWDANTPFGFNIHTTMCVASTIYKFAFNLNSNSQTFALGMLGGYLPDCVIGPDGYIGIGAGGIKANDQFSNVIFVCKRIEM